jgi:endonuclease/exonuclease/phosphatase family metal-dependent hydrolase
MSRCFRLLAVAYSLTSVFATDIAAAADVVRVATYNCEFLNRRRIYVKYGLPLKLLPEDEAIWNSREFRDARFQEAARAVAAAIREINADVIGLTEVGDESDVRDLQSYVKDAGLDYSHMAVGRSTDTVTGQSVAVLSKRELKQIVTEIPGREGYDQELDDPENETTTGISKGMSVVFTAAGRPVNFYVLHLTSELGGHEKDAQRVAQASIVRRHYLKPMLRGEHVIISGDLNDDRSQPTLRRIRGRDDIDEDLIQTAGPTFHPRKLEETDEQWNARLRTHWTYEYAGRKEQIDHILISPSIVDACSGENQRRHIAIDFLDLNQRFDNDARRVSDHRAVLLTLEFQQ